MALTQVKTTGLADDAVTSAKIADDAVVTAAIADDAVTGANIADDTVAEANMANDAISLAELKAGTDGQIITYDASGNPTAVGPGTDGQVLTSTGAGSPPAFESISIPAGTTINNNADNKVITGSGTANTLEGEANLTFDGGTLQQAIDANDEGYTILADGNHRPTIVGDRDATGEHDELLHLVGKWNNTQVGAIDIQAGGDTSNKDDGHIIFYTSSSGGSLNNRMKIHNDGTVAITDGDLKIATAGHGIDFSAGSHATNMSSELLDDYEEGDFTVTLSATGGGTLGISGNDHMKYTKIGNRVFISGSIDCNAHSSATGFLQVNGFPFTVEHDGSAANCTHIGVVYFRGGDSTPGSTGNYGDFAVRWTMGANETAAYAQAVYGGLTDSGSQNTAQYVGESTYIYFNFSYPAA